MYTEVTDQKEILRLLAQLRDVARKATALSGRRVIGSPGGQSLRTVRFGREAQAQGVWWCSSTDEETGDYLNMIGHGDSASADMLLMDLQFNFDKEQFTRLKGGAFLHDQSGRAYLAHRGIVTKGHSRISRQRLLLEANVTVVEAVSARPPYRIDCLLVAPLNSPTFLSEVEQFAREIRRAANAVADPAFNPVPRGFSTGGAGAGAGDDPFDIALAEYYEEFSGTAKVRRRAAVTMEWRHGAVVSALRSALANEGVAYKSKEIDLLIDYATQICLFEVKTSADTQSLYTAIGQLVFHRAALARRFKRRPIQAFLVLPTAIGSEARRRHCKELGFGIVDYALEGKVYRFSGLPQA